jgi:ATP-dependent exoDNAse (exonuclease V) alpha subunit
VSHKTQFLCFVLALKVWWSTFRPPQTAAHAALCGLLLLRRSHGPAADQNIARNTRAAKLNQTPEEIKAAHLEHATKFGNEPERVVSAARGRKVELPSKQSVASLAENAVHWAKGRLSERTTVMEDHEIHRDALRFGRGFITLPDVEKAFEQLKDDDFIEAKHWREYAPQHRWTTPELVSKERYILQFMADGRDQYRAMSRGITKDEFKAKFAQKVVAGKREGLNDDQMWKVWKMIHTTDRMVGIAGTAGAGKTTSLSIAKGFMEDYGYEVRGLAATSKATMELQDAGVPAQTLASFILRDEPVTRGRMYFLDESSLMDVHQAADFLGKLKPADRVVVIGDDAQHASLGAGRIFRELHDAGMATWRLNEIVRQKNAEYKEQVKNLSKGQVLEALASMDEQQQIRVVPNIRERYAAIAREYITSPPKTLVVSPDNRSRVEIAVAIRDALKDAGALGPNVYQARTLQPRTDFRKADAAVATSYRVGDVISYARSSRKIGVERGDYAAVLNADGKRNELTVMRESDGKVFTYNPVRSATSASVYEPAARELAVGERVQITKSLPNIANRAQGTIERLDVEGNVTLRMDRGNQKLSFNLEKMGHIEYGYVTTSYSSQATTAPKVIVHMDTDSPAQALLNRAFVYVAWSRGQHEAVLYTNDRDDLNRVLLRSDEKAMALAPEEVVQYKARATLGR